MNDRLRADATRLLVDGALAAKTQLIVVPTAAFVYPPGPADESTPIAELPQFLRSALEAEAHLRRFTDAGRRGVALRLGSLYGPEAASAVPTDRYNVRLLLTTRVERWWPRSHALGEFTTSAMTPTR